MTWAFRLISTPTGVAVHHVYWEAGAEHPTSCGATPFVAEAANVGHCFIGRWVILVESFPLRLSNTRKSVICSPAAWHG